MDPDVFTKMPETMLGRMFSCGFDFHPNSRLNFPLPVHSESFSYFSFLFRGEYEVADGIPASVFSAILDFYHSGIVYCPPHVHVAEMREARNYLCCTNRALNQFPMFCPHQHNPHILPTMDLCINNLRT